MNPLTWTVEITFSEDEDKTRADATLTGGADELQGWRRARRNPADARTRQWRTGSPSPAPPTCRGALVSLPTSGREWVQLPAHAVTFGPTTEIPAA
jgi:hypothetical protein